MASTKKSPAKRKQGEPTATATKKDKKAKFASPPSTPAATSQQQQGPPSSSEQDAERTARLNKRAEKIQQESGQKKLGPVPRKTSGSETVASTKETTDQKENAATSDEKVDP
jgi:tRNA A37 methylthiotransferase MiaB